MAAPAALRPLRRTEYRRLAAVLLLSLLSEGLWPIAVVWQVIGIHGGPVAVSSVSTSLATGLIASSLLGGAIADRVPRRGILTGVQATRAVVIGAAGGLALAGALDVVTLAVVAAVSGLAMGLYYPAYTAMLPTTVAESDLQAVTGLEGVLRPLLLQTAGPLLAGVLVAAASPAVALLATAVSSLIAMICGMRLPVGRPDAEPGSRSARAVWQDLRAGFAYVRATPWLLASLALGAISTLTVIGPLDVLVPFVVVGGAATHVEVLAANGLGTAVSSLLAASWRLPRRHLTVLFALWSVGGLPLLLFALSGERPAAALAGLVIGCLQGVPAVIWGTLLLNRVPRALLGRVAAMDFFVSLTFLPLATALAGPLATVTGVRLIFLVAPAFPLVAGIAVLLNGGLRAHETPLGEVPE